MGSSLRRHLAMGNLHLRAQRHCDFAQMSLRTVVHWRALTAEFAGLFLKIVVLGCAPIAVPDGDDEYTCISRLSEFQ